VTDSPFERLFRERLAEAIGDLAFDGWEVLVGDQLTAPAVPRELLALKPDLVARKGSELLVGEIKARSSEDLADLNALAGTVAKLPNARFEVYWLGDETQTEPGLERIRELAAEARTLAATGHLAAAVVIAWAALEGALERYATEAQAPVTTDSDRGITAWPLLSRLYSLGYVSEADFKRLREVRKRRNAAVHFGPDDPPRAEDIGFTLALAERLGSGRYVPVDQMMEWYIDRYDYPHPPTEETGRGVEVALIEQFPTATAADVREAVARLLQDAAI
jgi:hypothetical protein